jgi:hypothetical protein
MGSLSHFFALVVRSHLAPPFLLHFLLTWGNVIVNQIIDFDKMTAGSKSIEPKDGARK